MARAVFLAMYDTTELQQSIGETFAELAPSQGDLLARAQALYGTRYQHTKNTARKAYYLEWQRQQRRARKAARLALRAANELKYPSGL